MSFNSEALVGLILLQVGHCTGPLSMTERGAPFRGSRFPAGIALLSHPKYGHTLFDTGYGKLFWEATLSFPERIYRWLTPSYLHEKECLPFQLHARGIEELQLVFLSHLHADHIAGLFDLPRFPRIITSAEAIKNLDKNRLATLLAGCPRKMRDALRSLPLETTDNLPPIDLAPYGLGDFGKGYDLFGDKSALTVSLPGHGFGQTGLFLPYSSLGKVFLVADAIWSLEALQRNSPPPDLTLSRLGDREAYLSTFGKLFAFHQTHPDVKIVASHCSQFYSNN